MSQSDIQCRVRALDHLVLTVANIPATVRFYAQVLGLRGQQFTGTDGNKRWALHFGQSRIDLHQRDRTSGPTADKPTPGSADLCFLTDAPMDAWLRHLTIHGVVIEEGPVVRSGATGALFAIYIRDPDRNLIEIGAARGP